MKCLVFKMVFIVYVSVVLVVPLNAVAASLVKIPAGTPVSVNFNENLSASTHKVGDRVIVSVEQDVIIDGKVVIEKGAKVFAEMTKAKEPFFIGLPGELLLAFRTVQTKDNQNISLSGIREARGEDKMIMSIGIGLAGSFICCPLGFLLKGGEATIPQGSSVTVYVLADSDVTLQ